MHFSLHDHFVTFIWEGKGYSGKKVTPSHSTPSSGIFPENLAVLRLAASQFLAEVGSEEPRWPQSTSQPHTGVSAP